MYQISSISRGKLFLMEAFVIFEMSFLLYFLRGNPPSWLGYSLMLIIAWGLLVLMQKQSFSLSFVLSLGLVFGMGLLAGFSPLVSLILTLIICWRSAAHYKGNSGLTAPVILITSLILAPFIYTFGYGTGYPYREQILLAVLVPLVIHIGGSMLDSVFHSKAYMEKSERQKSWLFFSGVAGALSAGALLLTYALLNFIDSGLSFALRWGAYLFSLLAAPIFKLLDFEITPKPMPKKKEMEVSDLEQTNVVNDTPHDVYLVIGLILFILFAAFVIYRLVKMDAVRIKDFNESKPDGVTVVRQNFIQKASSKKTSSLPHHRIRRQIYELEKISQKKKMGRHSSETLQEWLMREGLLEPDAAVVYEKLRYGEKEITAQEEQAFDLAMKAIRANLDAKLANRKKKI